MYHIHEARTECPPILDKEVFFSEKYFFYKYLIVFVESTRFNNLQSVLYFPVYDMFFDDEFEEIIFEDVI